jgi:excinuclease ABC subunit B
MPDFELISDLAPAGDQPESIAAMVNGVGRGDKFQTLLGITGSGKSFAIANVIAQANRPTLVMAPNKSLAAQLAAEFRELFPKNRVEYFVSYYDYYQPEAYLPTTDLHREGQLDHHEIDRLRHPGDERPSRRDVITSSVSGITAPFA